MGMFGRVWPVKEDGRRRVFLDCRFVDGGNDVHPTKESFADEVDINKILKKFERTGMVTHLNSREPFYGDVSEIVSYPEALQVVFEAQALFGSLSAEVRERFANDPARMIAFLDNPQNLEEAVKLGLVVKRPVEPVEAPVVPPGTVTP